jgi:hypothetical protein
MHSHRAMPLFLRGKVESVRFIGAFSMEVLRSDGVLREAHPISPVYNQNQSTNNVSDRYHAEHELSAFLADVSPGPSVRNDRWHGTFSAMRTCRR